MTCSKTAFLFLLLFLNVGFCSDSEDSSDDSMEWKKVSAERFGAVKEKPLGALQVYKTKRKFEEDKLEDLFKRKELEDGESALKLEDDFYLFCQKRPRTAPSHVEIAYDLSKRDNDDEESDESLDKGTTIKSTYIINTTGNTFLIPFGGGISFFNSSLLDSAFGRQLKYKFLPHHLRCLGESVRNHSSQIISDESRRFHHPIPVQKPNLLVRKIHKSQRLLCKQDDVLAHTAGAARGNQGKVRCEFRSNFIKINHKVELGQLPALCQTIEKWHQKPNRSKPNQDETLVEDKKRIKELEDALIITIRDDESPFSWSIIPPLNSDDDDFDEFTFFEGRVPADTEISSDDETYDSLEEACFESKKKLKEALKAAPTDKKEDKVFKGSRIIAIKAGKTVTQNWFLYKQVHATIKLGDTSYALDEGKWSQLPKINTTEMVKSLEIDDLGGLIFKKAVDKKDNKLSETAFNFRIGIEKKADHFLSLDRIMVPYDDATFGDLASSFEPFDLIDLKKKRLITVKRDTEGAPTSHLLNQGLLAAEFYQMPIYLKKIKFLFLATETYKRAYDCKILDDFERNKVYKNGCDFMNTFRDVDKIDESDFIQKLEASVHKSLQGNGQSLPTGTTISSIIQGINNPTFKGFFDHFDPTEVTVVFAFITNKGKLTSYNVRENLLACQDTLKRRGYDVGVAYIKEQ